LNFINFILFLYDGKYVTPANRLLGLRLVYQATRARSVSFEFMNRQLLWNGFTEFMFFLMPMINVGSTKEYFGNLFLKFWGGQGDPGSLNLCPICRETPQTPYCDSSRSCCHCFCYYCIKEKLMEQNSYTCPFDGVSITTITQYQATS